MTPSLMILSACGILAVLVTVWSIRRGLRSPIACTTISSLVIFALVLSMAVLAITGLPCLIDASGPLHGNVLMIHVAAGGAFLLLAAAASVLWLRGLSGEIPRPLLGLLPRLLLLLFLVFVIATGLPVLLAMTTLFDSTGQLLLMKWHEVAAAALVATSIPVFATYLNTLRRPKG